MTVTVVPENDAEMIDVEGLVVAGHAGRGAVVRQGDARSLPLADGSVDLVVTSPPYFALRSYQDGEEPVEEQIGGEATPEEYLASLWAATAEMVRVLKPTGSIWVNLGDKYAGGGQGGHTGPLDQSEGYREARAGGYTRPKVGVPSKSLMGLPWRYANGCVDQLGLILRRDVVWDKPSGLPEAVTDRCRTSHEYWFHLTKKPHYFAALDELREPYTGDRTLSRRLKHDGGGKHDQRAPWARPNPLGSIPGSVWTVAAEPLTVPDELGVDHFAAFPGEFPRRIIAGWAPEKGVVLDPFGGTGTTAMMARAMGRIGISIDLSSDYCRLAEWRIFESKHAAKVLKRATAAGRRAYGRDMDRAQADLDAAQMALDVETEKRRIMEREVALLRRSGSTFGVTLEAKGIVASVIPSKTNGLLIAAAAQLYITPDDVVMDVTYGRGKWWTDYQHPGHRFISHDIRIDGVDFRDLPEPDGSVDVVMCDPPYTSMGGRATSTVTDFADRYGLIDAPRTPAEVQQLIDDMVDEAVRVLRPFGRLMVKCGDYVSSGRLVLGRHHTVSHALSLGLVQLDEFVHASGTGPQPSVNLDGSPRRQVHSRRAHSFLLVFGKQK